MYLFTAESNFERNHIFCGFSSRRKQLSPDPRWSASVLIPAQIQYVVQLDLADNTNTPVTFVTARQYLQANVKCDSFSTYPFLRVEQWSREFDSLGLYTPEIIDAHFAHCPMKWEERQVMAVISLSRVSYSLNTIGILLIGIRRSTQADSDTSSSSCRSTMTVLIGSPCRSRCE